MKGRRNRRQQIVECAAGLCARRGVAATTMRQIADEVGILSGSLYHHFESKEAIVEAILGPYVDDLRERYRAALADPAEPRAQLELLVRASLETTRAYPDATEIYQNDANYLANLPRFGYLRQVRREVQSTWIDVIRAGIDGGQFRADVDPKVFYRLVRDALWPSVRWSRRADFGCRTHELVRACTAVFLEGLATRPPSA